MIWDEAHSWDFAEAFEAAMRDTEHERKLVQGFSSAIPRLYIRDINLPQEQQRIWEMDYGPGTGKSYDDAHELMMRRIEKQQYEIAYLRMMDATS